MQTLESMGMSAVASRMKRLSDYCFEQVKLVYDSLSVGFEPSWYPYVTYLNAAGKTSIGEMVQALGVSQPAASAMVKKLVGQKLCSSRPLPEDARGRIISLTAKGKQAVALIAPIVAALESVVSEIDHAPAEGTGMLGHLNRFETAFRETSLHRRAIARLAEQLPLTCIPYEERLHSFYETHNRAWVEKYFQMEPHDEIMLKDPQTHILQKGGHIYIACLGQYPVGGFSLLPDGENRFELGKMYVPFALQGFGFGKRALQLSIEMAQKHGAQSMTLLSNRSLAPAIHLYRTHGFEEQTILPEDFARYKRVDIRMEKLLKVA